MEQAVQSMQGDARKQGEAARACASGWLAELK